MARLSLIVACCLVGLAATVQSMTILDKIKDDPDLSQFYDLIEKNAVAMSNLKLRSLTIFAPTNEAFQMPHANVTHVQYHMSTSVFDLDHLSNSITSDLDGNPPLYITKRRKNNQDHIWINNAMVIRSRSNVQLTNELGKKQILHVIESVLSPLTTTNVSSLTMTNPDAFQMLTHADSLDIGQHRLRSYRQRIVIMQKESVFQAVGTHTFFIPIDEGFKPHPRPDRIDRKVIDGHIIHDQAVFTGSAPPEEPFETVAFDDNIKVTISFFTQGEGANMKTYVKSNTVVGDSKHSTGVVMAEIVRANIPLKNGVAHFIHRPLMVVDTTVKEFLEDDGPLFRFYEAIMDSGDVFMNTINSLKDVTLFAPSNKAWDEANLQNVIRDKRRMSEILNLHIVADRLTTDRIRQSNANSIVQFPTMSKHKSLYFNVISSRSGNQTVTVEGGGVNATIIQADIVQVNGYVHIIDRVLGVPHATVYDKMRTDPMLNATYHIGQQTGFNRKLNDSTKRFTYFVPRDWAWQHTEIEFPSTYKKMFMPEYGYHANNILERHLVISDRAYTMADLKALGNETIILPTIRDALAMRVKGDDKRYTISWNHRNINVFRPDVECTNGIIHVIDHPFIVESDVQVSGVLALSSTASMLLGSFASLVLARVLV